MIPPEPLPEVDILLEQGPCLVVNKPGGLLTQAPPEIDSIEIRIKRLLKIRENKPGKVYLGVPHRLDRPVSGVMVFAKHVRATRRLAEQFEQRQVTKKYWCLVGGTVDHDEGTWKDFMRKVPGEARSEIVDSQHPDRQQAVLHFRVLSRPSTETTWLEIELETGRTHQIRLQAGSRGFPILGDQLYGSSIPFGPETLDLRKRWIALHARRLEFEHPMTRDPVCVEAPLPDVWESFGHFDL